MAKSRRDLTMEEQEPSLLSKKKNERHLDELDWESQTTEPIA